MYLGCQLATWEVKWLIELAWQYIVMTRYNLSTIWNFLAYFVPLYIGMQIWMDSFLRVGSICGIHNKDVIKHDLVTHQYSFQTKIVSLWEDQKNKYRIQIEFSLHFSNDRGQWFRELKLLSPRNKH